jgi:hypothetical protein
MPAVRHSQANAFKTIISMRKFLYLTVLAAGLLACDKAAKKVADAEIPASESAPAAVQTASTGAEANAAAMKFEKPEHDFGTAKEGQVVEHTFTFTNTGSQPLVIQNAAGSCGCTVPDWPRTPIAPNATGDIKVKFDTKGKPGMQTKTVTIIANTNPQTTTLTLKGMVNADEVASMPGPVRTK